MAKEFFQDRPIDHDAAVAAYPPEMVNARDAFVQKLESIKARAKAADATGTLPPRLRLYSGEGGGICLDFGSLPDIWEEAVAQHHNDMVLAAMALELGGVGLPGSDAVIVTFAGRRPTAAEAVAVADVEEPQISVDWYTRNGDENIENSLAIYEDGYVEASYEVTRTEYVHPPNASDFMRAHAQPTIRQEVDVVSPTTQPAGIADVQNAAAQLAATMARYGISI